MTGDFSQIDAGDLGSEALRSYAFKRDLPASKKTFSTFTDVIRHFPTTPAWRDVHMCPAPVPVSKV